MDEVNQTASTTPIAIYRSHIYDKYDKIYAEKLNNIFSKYLSEQIQVSFNNYTKGLMNDEYISRNKLLNAIDDYQLFIGIDLPTIFTDNAFNCRPYQCY